MRLFCDMDGVLADFDTGYAKIFGRSIPRLNSFDNDGHDVDWRGIAAYKDFYLTLPPMADMKELWSGIAPFNPIILTGIPSSVTAAADNKKAWVRKHLGSDVEVRCCASKEKCLHAKPGDILIDDWEKYKALWEKQGGVWITHTSAQDTLRQLRMIHKT